jgi:glycosyltransferase involved in cell wall biosynthesis
MIVCFFQPPPDQRIGGLDLAIESLRDFLVGSGVTVQNDPPISMIASASGPEVVHFHGLWQRSFPRISAHCRRCGVPYVVSPHGMLEPWAWRHKWWKKWVYFYLVERRHLAAATSLLTTSAAEARNLKKFFPRSTLAVLPLGLSEPPEPNYTAARRTLGWSESEIVILFLSRIHPKKGLPLLLKALASIGPNPSSRRVRLVIVGSGRQAYVESLKAMARREQQRLPPVNWAGEIWGDAKWAYLKGADLLCLPSYSENFGLAVVEALQVGTRVLTTNQTPWHALPSWGGGWIVAPEVDALRGALAHYLAHPEWTVEQRRQLASEMRNRFSWETVGPAYLQFYKKIAAKGPLTGK